MKKKVAILGCGWVGLPLSQTLVDAGYTVFGSTTSESKLDAIRKTGAQPFFLHFPLSDFHADAGRFFSADVLVITLPFLRSYTDPWDYFHLISNVLNQINDTLFPQLVFTSSTSIYPENCGEVDETSDLVFLTERQKVLAVVESEILSRKGVVIRLGGLYGNDRVLSRSVRLDTPVNLIHQDDAVGVLQAVIEQSIHSEILNGVSDDHRTKRELFEKTQVPHTKTAKLVSNKKLKQLLGYSFVYPTVSEI